MQQPMDPFLRRRTLHDHVQVLGTVAVLRELAGLGDQSQDVLVGGIVLGGDPLHFREHPCGEPFDPGVGNHIEPCSFNLCQGTWRSEEDGLGKRLLLSGLDVVAEEDRYVLVIAVFGWKFREA